MRQEHGLKNHIYYARWLGLVQRCYNPTTRSYATYGALGIKVAHEWDRRNPEGVRNFIAWVEKEVAKKREADPTFFNQPFVIGRQKVNQDFSPENCYLTTRKEAAQSRRTTALNYQTVVDIRKHKRMNPDVSIGGLAALFKQTIENTSRCLYGVTWANVNKTEAPLPSPKRPRKKVAHQEGASA